MTQRDRTFATTTAILVTAFAACTTPNPDFRKPGEGTCAAGAALRCDGTNLVSCNADGTAEVSEPCSVLCSDAELQCADMAPSNGLDKFLDLASGQPDLSLGDSATIDTDTGAVKVEGNPVPIPVYSGTLAQSPAPTIRVYVVKSLVAKDVVVTGNNALAIVSAGDVHITGTFTASAQGVVPGAGEFVDGNCRGQNLIAGCINSNCQGGPGGGGFGSPGGSGGSARTSWGYATGGFGGAVTGNAELVPLRGGCSGGNSQGPDEYDGGGGGAIQLVSRTRITIDGIVAANGGSGPGAGGSGGGILLEAPIVAVSVSGRVVTNGAGGRGFEDGKDGTLDAMQAKGGDGRTTYGRGGNGGAGTYGATNGESIDNPQLDVFARGGAGGGGVGRIRVNTASGSVGGTDRFSPPPSTGTLAPR